MESLLSINFWGFALVFVLAVLFSWIVPGILILHKLRIELEALSQLVLSLILGLCLWGLQAYAFGYLNLRFLTFAYVGIAVVLGIVNRKLVFRQFLDAIKSLLALPKGILMILMVGMFIQIAQMFGSGLISSQGMAFFRVHMQDGIYHLSMITSIARSFPPQEPGAAGVLVQNYHYWSDLIFADLVRVFKIPANYLFFQYIPPVFSLFTGLAVISLLRLWTKRKAVWFFGLFFLFFGADVGYLVAYLIHHQFSFQYPVIDNGATQFLNMPHVLAKLVFLTSLMTLTLWLKEIKWKWGVVTLFLTAVLFGLKIYFALYAILGLALIGLISLGLRKFSFVKQLIVCGIVGALLALVIYLPPNRGAGGLGFYPLEWPKLIIAEGNLDWRSWRYKVAVAQLEGETAKIILYDVQVIIITFLAIHGIRILGFLFTKKTIKEVGGVWIAYLIIPSLIFTFLGLFTLQVSGSFNVFNFFATSLVPLSLLVAFLFADLWRIKIVGKIFVIVLLLLSLPRIVFETEKILVSYKDSTDVVYISKDEIAALSFINNNYPQSCVISASLNNRVDLKTPYVSYFSNRESWMSGQRVLETHDAPTQARNSEFKSIFAGNQAAKIESALRSKGVCALYLQGDDPLKDYFKTHVKLTFQNSAALVVDLR